MCLGGGAWPWLKSWNRSDLKESGVQLAKEEADRQAVLTEQRDISRWCRLLSERRVEESQGWRMRQGEVASSCEGWLLDGGL